jgi:diguanylate cyclase (GGDEF)-like protein/PAS domain S-box-containing protein
LAGSTRRDGAAPGTGAPIDGEACMADGAHPGHGRAREIRDLPRELVASTGAMVVVVDATGRIRLVNPSLERFVGRPAADLLGCHFWDVYVVPGDALPAQRAFADAVTAGASFAVEADWLAADGLPRRVAMDNSVLFDAEGRPHGVACVAIDVTTVHERSTTDSLTRVRNRAGLFEVLRRHLDGSRGAGCGVLFCDLDDFKAVNDRYGHAIGDRLLVEAAQRLLSSTGPADTTARFGGDEFVVVQPGTDEKALAALAAKVADGMRPPVPTPVGPLRIGVTIGRALAGPGDDPDELLARADSTMYGNKHRKPRRGSDPAP